jgi:hypothetical protein
MTLLLIIIDQATGGQIKLSEQSLPTYGHYTPDILFPIYMAIGSP